jgi:galactose mutarotase-like enzyme
VERWGRKEEEGTDRIKENEGKWGIKIRKKLYPADFQSNCNFYLYDNTITIHYSVINNLICSIEYLEKRLKK